MKKSLLIFALGLAMAFSATAQQATNKTFSVTLEWDPNPEPDIAGYIIYTRQLGGTYLPALTVTNGVRGTITSLAPGSTWFFVATAYNTSGLESDYSNEVTCTLPAMPVAPPVLRIISTNLVSNPQ